MATAAGRVPRPDRVDAPRMAALKPRRPTGRYVYESSSDEDSDADPVTWRTAPLSPPVPGLESSDEEEDAHGHDLSDVRLANELDPWDRWEAACQRKAWVRRLTNAAPCLATRINTDARRDAPPLRRRPERA